MDSGLPELAQHIRTARLQAKLTREELSERIGVTAKSIQRYEEGKQVPRVRTLGKLAEVLGTSLAELTSSQTEVVKISLDDLAQNQKAILQKLDQLTISVESLLQKLNQ